MNMEKTSSGAAREKSKCEINKVLIGKVTACHCKIAISIMYSYTSVRLAHAITQSTFSVFHTLIVDVISDV